MDPATTPHHLDLKKDRGLTVEWADGRSSYYTIAYLRRMSPSADMKMLRDEIAKNPLTIVGAGAGSASGPVVATGAELVGHYAIRIEFSDGHGTGLFSWAYLREIDPSLADARREGDASEGGAGSPGRADGDR